MALDMYARDGLHLSIHWVAVLVRVVDSIVAGYPLASCHSTDIVGSKGATSELIGLVAGAPRSTSLRRNSLGSEPQNGRLHKSK